MAAIKRDVERFVDAPPPEIFLFLLYGADAGLARERALRIARARVEDSRDPFQLIEMSGDAVAADPLRLLDEANSVPMFGGRRAIVIDAGAKSIVDALQAIVNAPPTECSIIVIASALKSDNALRRLVEGAKGGAAVECSPDGEAETRILVETSLRAAGLSAANDAMELLCAALGEDRMMSRAELAKLVLFAHGKTRIEASDVETIVAQAATLTADRAVYLAYSGDAEAIGAELDRSLAHGADAAQLIVTALRYALSLHRGKHGGGVMGVKRGGFFGLHDAVISDHLKRFSAERLERLIESLRLSQTRARAHAERAKLEAVAALLRIARG